MVSRKLGLKTEDGGQTTDDRGQKENIKQGISNEEVMRWPDLSTPVRMTPHQFTLH